MMNNHANIWTDMYIHRIAFEKAEVISDGMGGSTKGKYAPVKETEALVQPNNSDEWYLGEQQGHRLFADIYFPPLTGITEDMRIRHLDTGDVYSMESDPINQGGHGEVMLIKGERGELGDGS